jgi:hypothetical protein
MFAHGIVYNYRIKDKKLGVDKPKIISGRMLSAYRNRAVTVSVWRPFRNSGC